MASNIVQTSMGLFHEADVCRLLWDPVLDKLSPTPLYIKNSSVSSMDPLKHLSNSIITCRFLSATENTWWHSFRRGWAPSVAQVTFVPF